VSPLNAAAAEAVGAVDTVIQFAAASIAGSSILPWITTHRAAVALIFAVVGGSFATGGIAALWAHSNLSLPARVTALEERQIVTDSVAAERWIVVERLVCQLREEQTGSIPPECDRRIIR